MTPTPVPPGKPDVVIERIFFDGLVIQTESDEFVQIINRGSVSADIGGWTLRDVSDGSPTFTFPSYTLASSKSIRVYTNEVHIEWGGFPEKLPAGLLTSVTGFTSQICHPEGRNRHDIPEITVSGKAYPGSRIWFCQ